MCDYRSDAKIVAKSVDKNKFYEDSVHGGGEPGFYPHFHPNREPNHPHIWYLVVN